MAVPTLIQKACFGGASNSTADRRCPLPNVGLNGNAIIVFVTCSNGSTPTVSDDQSGSYTTIQNTNDVTNGQRAFCAYRLNIGNDGHAVPNYIKITGAGNTFMEVIVTEWKNIPTSAATDGSAGQATSGTSVTPGSITTTADGELILTYIVEDSISAFSTDQCISSWTTPTSFVPLSLDRWGGHALAYQIQSTQGAINPSWTLSPSRSVICLQVAFKQATQGTSASASPRVVGVIHQGLDYAGSHTSPYVLQLPAEGGSNRMLYAAFIGLRDPGTLSDSNSNTWTATGASIRNNVGGNSGFVRCYFSQLNPTISAAMTFSLAYTGAGAAPGDTLIFYEVEGLVSSLDQHVTKSDTSGTGTSYTTPSLTPSNSGGIIFVTTGEDANTSLSCTPGIFIPSTDPAVETSPWANDENNFWAWYKNPDTSAVTFTVTTDAAAGPIATIVDSFGPGGGGGGGGGGACKYIQQFRRRRK